eukprot:CAMPEP_0194213434 /NCGR_PEP_ID=MMETSP0156-20130528/14029_1 /TAXON_ID=33649 /ORGANISM="Thalassionema nitzschioides, Strain L26-B" /LENGTH=1116 /DNA_ID=CAMNT_0038941461 /DNA_START=280 /DNA_END=3630 /DNA_ORIENTATION=+
MSAEQDDFPISLSTASTSESGTTPQPSSFQISEALTERLDAGAKSTMREPEPLVTPHRGALCRTEVISSKTSGLTYQYSIKILLESGDTHKLLFNQHDFEFMSHLFSILDTESRGLVGKSALREFVTLRCPVFWRRDEDLRKLGTDNVSPYNSSPTFDEVWEAVRMCGKSVNISNLNVEKIELGVEGWMVFCRFVVLAQYLEAKRRFSARHLQQTMRHRNSPRGSEVVVVDVPPPAPPIKLTPLRLAEHEKKGKLALPLPELDLDHCLIFAHDALRNRSLPSNSRGVVKVTLFGSKPKSVNILSPTSDVEFALSYEANGIMGEEIIVRRSCSDLKWLNQTFKSHRGAGGTLCGRILPPFPPSSSSSLATQFKPDDKTLQNAIDGTGAAVKAAAASVGMIKNVAKSIWGNYGPTFGSEKKIEQKQSNRKPIKKPLTAISDKYYNPNSPTGKARHLERYLNYLLEHPALSTSFPLNTILKASQSGLESAKLFLEDQAKIKRDLHSQPQLADWRTASASLTDTSNDEVSSLSRQHPNLLWVRTAAQAAMALQVHGLLETTGLPSASARLQHASLPSFNQSGRNSGWVEEDDEVLAQESPSLSGEASSGEGAENFERGVVSVETESDGDGYDLLPLPIPAPERRILCAGSVPQVSSAMLILNGPDVGFHIREERFHYGVDGDRVNISQHCEVESAFLGDFQVDDNIDKLREVIGSVESTLSRCLSASGGIGAARRERLGLHLELVQGFDSWEGLRGRFIAQRALLKGVTGLEQSKEISEESDLDIVDDISWQSALASSAVMAAEDVRSTVRAARTAANAKAAADSAAFAAQTACEGDFPSIDEARAAQTRSSIAQSHAIHAAVVEHEANTAKRRAALALAHDVKCWNVHRKRELLQSCLSYAKSQHVATRRAVDAWLCLRDGYLGSAVIPEARLSSSDRLSESESGFPEIASASTANVLTSQHVDEDPIAHIYSEIPSGTESAFGDPPKIEAVDHIILSTPLVALDEAIISESKTSDNVGPQTDAPETKLSDEPSKPLSAIKEEENLPIVDAAPVLEVEVVEPEKPEETEIENPLTESMQSLVDGLMSWGGQYDSEDDLNLPVGMAASIALEESGISHVN